jgi:hypothetical protein
VEAEEGEAGDSRENQESLQSNLGVTCLFLDQFHTDWMCVRLHCTGWENIGRYGLAVESFIEIAIMR